MPTNKLAFMALSLHIVNINDYNFAISWVLDMTCDSCPWFYHFNMIEHDKTILEVAPGCIRHIVQRITAEDIICVEDFLACSHGNGRFVGDQFVDGFKVFYALTVNNWIWMDLQLNARMWQMFGSEYTINLQIYHVYNKKSNKLNIAI